MMKKLLFIILILLNSILFSVNVFKIPSYKKFRLGMNENTVLKILKEMNYNLYVLPSFKPKYFKSYMALEISDRPAYVTKNSFYFVFYKQNKILFSFSVVLKGEHKKLNKRIKIYLDRYKKKYGQYKVANLIFPQIGLRTKVKVYAWENKNYRIYIGCKRFFIHFYSKIILDKVIKETLNYMQ